MEVVPMIALSPPTRLTAIEQNDERFLEMLPAIERHARLTLHDLPPQSREEAVWSVVGNAFCAFRRLVELGKRDVAHSSSLARFAVARYRAGRCISNRLNSRDVCAFVARRRRGFCLQSLNSSDSSSIWADVLADDRLTPIPDQVAFRLDFLAWLKGLNRRDRKLARFLALGNTTTEAAIQFGVTRGRISQLRSGLRASWRSFQQEASPGRP
jgi:hypothetical protein